MNDPLAIYLHDHLTGSHFAIKLLNSLHEQYKDEDLGRFAMALSAEVKRDQDTLQQIIDHVGRAHFDLTEAVGWAAEKVSHFKLRRDDPGGGLGTFEALEALSLGIRGKLALWRALPLIRDVDQRVPAEDFGRLAVRADGQFANVEAQRLQLIHSTFRPQPGAAGVRTLM
jgi:hypothetical protein